MVGLRVVRKRMMVGMLLPMSRPLEGLEGVVSIVIE